MDYKGLGNTGVRVSQLCLGTMSFGKEADEAEAKRMFSACRELGINFFDCANGYNAGRAEEILGRLMKSERDELVITSKCFVPMGEDVNARGGNRRHIALAVDASLKRLGTDRIDVLFMHRWDPVVPIEETLRALEKLISDGKVLYLGASNYSAWQVAKALGISARNGWPRFEVLQPMYSLVKRQVESEILPLAHEETLGVITYSPVGGGLLSGKYGPGRRPDAGRLIENPQYTRRYREEWAFETAAAITARAEALGVHPVSLAVAWVAAHPDVTCPIVGGRSLEQLGPSLDALKLDMTPELRDELSALSRTPPPATDRLEDQPEA
jgi:aryl-alcohol dehydrogenase-like predicted oxidoreductase